MAIHISNRRVVTPKCWSTQLFRPLRARPQGKNLETWSLKKCPESITLEISVDLCVKRITESRAIQQTYLHTVNTAVRRSVHRERIAHLWWWYWIAQVSFDFFICDALPCGIPTMSNYGACLHSVVETGREQIGFVWRVHTRILGDSGERWPLITLLPGRGGRFGDSTPHVWGTITLYPSPYTHRSGLTDIHVQGTAGKWTRVTKLMDGIDWTTYLKIQEKAIISYVLQLK